MAELLPMAHKVPSQVYICTGSDCRKRSKELRAITQGLEGVELCAVKCQKICKGPVVGVEVQGRMEWFSKLKEFKVQEQLRHFIQTGELKKRLRARMSRSRSGKFRGARIRRASKAA